MGDQYYVDEYDEEPDMDELMDYMSPDEGDGDLAGFERPEMNVDFSTAVVVSNLPKVCMCDTTGPWRVPPPLFWLYLCKANIAFTLTAGSA